MTDQIHFNDGAAYERYMGKWSQLVGEKFLDWLAPQSNLRWLDIGCGGGAFTRLLVDNCAPLAVHGIDPSQAQIDFARSQFDSPAVQFSLGDAMQLAFSDDSFDVAVMPLVIFFVPNPAVAIAEMARVVCPGGTVGAYAWDMLAGGFPYDALLTEVRELGIEVAMPPSIEASQLEQMRKLWIAAGLKMVETEEICVQRSFLDFDHYWTTILDGPNLGAKLGALPPNDSALLKERLRKRLVNEVTGQITYSARANAVKGCV